MGRSRVVVLGLTGLALVCSSGCITNPGDYAEGEGCTNTCRYAFDNDCDDGGEGSDFSLCELGTDCGDCGRRDGVDRPGPGPVVDPGEDFACRYTRHSRFTCAGTGTGGTTSTNEGCAAIRSAASRADAEADCRSRTQSDTSCSGSCCSRSYYTNVRVLAGGC